MNMFYRLYEQSQDATMEQVRDYAKKTGEEIRLQISRPTPTGTVSIYLVYDRLFCVKEEAVTNIERNALLGDENAQWELTVTDALLPCPLCGSKNVDLYYGPNECYCGCEDCGCKGPCENYEPGFYGDRDLSAIREWNTRPTPPIGKCIECLFYDRGIENTGKCKIHCIEEEGIEEYHSDNYYCGDFKSRFERTEGQPDD